MPPVGWSVLVPLKTLPRAKTRLRGALAGVGHERLVLALAQATVRAALSTPSVTEVVVVTGDPVVRRRLAQPGVRFAADGAGPDPLNEALRAAAEGLSGDRPVAALTGDVPALRPAELGAALTLAAGHRSFVPDLPGTGTVLLAAPRGVLLDPRFGPDSAAAHTQTGAHRLDGAWPSLRRDVDTAADLAEAVQLGFQPPLPDGAAGAVPASTRRENPPDRAGAGRPGTLSAMQGTVSEFDQESRSGVVLLDDGTPVRFGAEAFDAGGLRLLRLGQRLRLEADEAGRVVRVTIPTMP